MKNTFAIPTIVGGQSTSGGGSSSGVSSVNGRTGAVVLSKSDVGLENYDSDIALLEGQIGANKDDIDTLQIEVTDINSALDNVPTESTIDSKIATHNLSNQSHNDIRNSIKSVSDSLDVKANLASQENDKIGNIAIVDKDGQYEVSDTKLTDINDDIDILNQQTGLLTTSINDIKDDYASKTKNNTITGKNTLQGDVVLSSNVRNAVNSKVILTTKTIDSNTEATYVGGDQVEIYAPDSLSIEAESVVVKRNDSTGTKQTYTNIDSGNISNYVSGGGTSTEEKYGIEADYATHYGILDCPNGLIDYSPITKRITVNSGVVLKVAGNFDTNGNPIIKTTIGSNINYDIEETGRIVLFYTTGTESGLLEAGDVFYQESEPSNGTTSYLAWWKPSLKKWQFKNNDTGNVWRAAPATPIANLNVTTSGVTSINYIGYRILDDDILVQQSDIDSINGTISAINTNVSTIDTEVEGLQTAVTVVNNELSTNVAKLSSDNTFAVRNVFSNGVTVEGGGPFGLRLNTTPIVLADGSQITDGNSNILLYKIESQKKTFVGGEKEIWVNAPDKITLQTSSLVTKRNNEAGTETEYTVVDSGNIGEYAVSKTGGDITGTVNLVSSASPTKKVSFFTNPTGTLYIGATSDKIILTGGYTPLTTQHKGVANGVATLDADGKIPTSQLPDGTALSGTVAGANVQVSYYHEGNQQTAVLDDFCSSVDHDLSNLTELVPNKQPAISQYTKSEMPPADVNPGLMIYISDLDCLAYSTGTVWKKVALETLPDDGDL